MPVVNREAPDKDHVQSVVFSKEFWTEETSREWLEAHKDSTTGNPYFTDGLDQNENQLRWRQFDPNADKFNYVSLVIEKDGDKTSIMFIRGIKK
jgi:hypothetical protein